MSEPRKEMLTSGWLERQFASLDKPYTDEELVALDWKGGSTSGPHPSTFRLAATIDAQRAEIERLTKELASEKEAQHVSWENYQISQEIERQRNEYALRAEALTEQVRTLREALEDVRANGALASHSHWDRQGTNGVNCTICIAQRELSARVRAALSASPAPAPTHTIYYGIPKPNGHICICWSSGATEPLGHCNDRNHWCHAAAPAPTSPNPHWIENVIRDVAELPDRDSPEGWPEAMIVTGPELKAIIENRAPADREKP